MQNTSRWIIFIFFLTNQLVEVKQILAQCTPPFSETCEEAYVFCSLNEMNGYSCNTPSLILSTCRPSCAGGGGPTNRTWWAFVSQGGTATITLNVGGCVPTDPNNPPLGYGLVLGVFGDCQCLEEISCIPGVVQQNQSKTYQLANLKPCKIYYLFLDSGGICDFTLNTSGGGLPPSIGDINNISGGIIQPVCAGACSYKLSTNIQGVCQSASFAWTLDGIDVGGNINDIYLDFPDEGDFVICVTAHIGSPNGSNCQVGPKCATVKVRKLSDRTGASRKVCYDYHWHSQYIYTSGTYREQLKDNNCCKFDSIVQFTVLPEPDVPNIFYVSCDNKPFTDILGRSYPLCKDHVFISLPRTTEPYKCDSAIILTSVNIGLTPKWNAKCAGDKVELSPNLNVVDTCGIGATYKINYKWYKKSDTAKVSIGNTAQIVVDTINEDYCLDATLNVRLGPDSAFCVQTFCDSINESKSGNTVQTTILSICDSVTINGTTYTQSTKFTQQLKNVFGCDSVIVTDLNIMKSNLTNLNFSGCDTVKVNNQVYTNTGIYKQSLTNTSGCDSILNLDINIGKSSQTNLALIKCDSIVVGGKTYTISGFYSLLLQSSGGCDSMVNLNLNIPKGSSDNFSFSACDSVNFNGKVYTTSGDYSEKYISSNGCDSIVNIHINITNSNNSPIKLTKCDSVTLNGTYYDQSGNYSQTLKSANGCDSTLNIELTISKRNSANYSFSSCDSALINGQWYLQSGNYTQLLQNVNQCDSTLNIDLNIVKSTSGDTLFRSCDSVKINGITYNQTGIYKQTLTNTNQCDSTLIIDFTRLSKSSTALNYKSCDSVVVNNQVYKQSGSYTQILVNANRCDSILNLDVEISKSNSSNISLSACDTLTINSKTYNQSGNYSQKLTNADQCDSTLNISLVIYKSSSINYVSKSCDSVNINGQIYKQSGNYIQYLKDMHQCDSTVNIQVNLSKSNTSNLSQIACDSIIINGKKYYVSGQYLQNLTNSSGCDSALTLDLTIKPGNPSLLEAGVDTSICDGEAIQLNGIFSGAAKFVWQSKHGNFDNPNSLSTNYYPGNIGNERIYLSAADDCRQWLDSLEVHILPKQVVQVTGDTILDPCKEITFTAFGGTNYIWTPASFIECLDPPCSRVILKSSVTTRFTINTDGPCPVPANLNLSVAQTQTDIYLPNAFSPNGDNINDSFLPIFNCEQVDYYNLQIFDRWGNLLFESQSKDKGWNGKYQDQNLNPGVYPYVIQYELHGSERKVKAGDVTLLR